MYSITLFLCLYWKSNELFNRNIIEPSICELLIPISLSLQNALPLTLPHGDFATVSNIGAEPAPEQSTKGGQAFIRGGQKLKLSTKAAVFKRVSLLFGGGASMSIEGQASMASALHRGFIKFYPVARLTNADVSCCAVRKDTLAGFLHL